MDAHNERQRRRRRLIGYQQWEPFTDAEPVRLYVQALLDDPEQTWSIQKMADAAGVRRSAISDLLYSRPDRPRTGRMRSETARALLGVRPDLDSYKPRALIAALGTQRRIQALYRCGWPLLHQGEAAGVSSGAGQRIPGYRYVTAATARAFRDMYDRLWDEKPEHHGIDRHAAAAARADGAARGWAPPGCWDEDALDDPAGFPDWTGHCGTGSGWLLHLLDGQEPCAACAPHAVDLQAPGVSRALSEACGDALFVIADTGRGWFAAARTVGVQAHQLEYARQLAKKRNLETAA